MERFALDPAGTPRMAARGSPSCRSRTLAAGVDAVGADTEAGRRLDETCRFFAFLRAELPALVRRWRAQR
ncbi:MULTISPECIES: hypothetical protein [unclassified Saccharopolyspora]|uniref:hypothetical protein n=1 Tax=unclassified Saccharopolyspora TaxID=2646250 RepID=UPI001CD41D6F|nr:MULTISPECIES: hypothetical protein [unclassified Saccharopolyspora]MCA1190168.1 hypothetical protein [Saccharopolyspora sp. 6T]MCA1194550.1 hypothetical protein [Saccharopolyspora sp. 6V]MCA1226735.1 hypothetical protein [Saccharopolyspora sp. 6M]MCA1281634.1 hypothetical protein [Saccharopolyspora sp. 7B]